MSESSTENSTRLRENFSQAGNVGWTLLVKALDNRRFRDSSEWLSRRNIFPRAIRGFVLEGLEKFATMPLQKAILPYVREITGIQTPKYSVDKMVGDASSREYFRIKISEPKNIESLVLMKFNPITALKSDEASCGEISLQHFPFIDIGSYLDTGGIRVPRLMLVALDRGLIFLEDLGNTQMYDMVADPDSGNRLKYYRMAIDLLVDFQKLTADKPSKTCIAFSREFSHDLLMWECNHYLEWGVENLHQMKISDSDFELFQSSFDRLCTALIRYPQTIAHRDYQSRNLMVVGEEELAAIDFQDALSAPLPYDLVALLRDSYIALKPDFIEEMISYYLDRHESVIGTRLKHEEFRHMFLMQTVQRKLKDAGRFVFIDRVKKNPWFLQFIPDSLQYVSWAISQLPEYEDLSMLLGKYEERLKS